MKKRILIASIFAIIFVAVITLISLNPLSKSEERIRADVLKLIPIGTDMHEVHHIVANHRTWELRFMNYDRGFTMRDTYGPTMSISSSRDSYVVGEKAISVLLGTYFPIFPFSAYVEAFFAFDEDGMLIEVAVRKGSNV
jgi:hypothetical protein